MIAPLLDEQLQPARRNRYTLLGQSRPVFLYAGNEHEDVKIDLKHRPSSVNFELSRVLPEKIEVNGRIVECELQTEVSARDIHLLPWSPSSALPAQDWPIVGYDGRRFSGRRGTQLYRRSGGEYSPQAVSKGEAVVDNLTFGRYEVRVTLAAKLTSKASKDDFLPAEEGGEPTDAKGTLEQLMAAAGSGGGGGSIAMMNAGGGMMSSMFSAGPKNEDEVEDLTVNLKPGSATHLETRHSQGLRKSHPNDSRRPQNGCQRAGSRDSPPAVASDRSWRPQRLAPIRSSRRWRNSLANSLSADRQQPGPGLQYRPRARAALPRFAGVSRRSPARPDLPEFRGVHPHSGECGYKQGDTDDSILSATGRLFAAGCCCYVPGAAEGQSAICR